MNKSEIADRWHEKGYSCDLWVDPPGKRWEGYVHDTDELVYVLDGTLELEINGKAQILNQGDEAFIPARAVHSVRNVGATEARWFYGYRKV